MNILGRDKMLDVTRDMLLTEAYLRNNYEPDSVAQQLYESVLEKHGVSKATYDSSCLWYNERAQRMDKIYEKLEKEFNENKLLLDTLYIDSIEMERIRLLPNESLWRGPNRWILFPNQKTYFADQSLMISGDFEPGDTIEWFANLRPASYSDSLVIRLQLVISDANGYYSQRISSQISPDSLHTLRHIICLPDSLPPQAMGTIQFWILRKPHTKQLLLDHFYLGKKLQIIPESEDDDTLGDEEPTPPSNEAELEENLQKIEPNIVE